MKSILTLAAVFFIGQVFAQKSDESTLLSLSASVFRWEVGNHIDSLEGLLAEKFRVVTSRGDMQTKDQYLATLRSGNVFHDSIRVEQNSAGITGTTAIVTGRGWFHMTVSNNKLHRHLSYMEVFGRTGKRWTLLALYASVLPD